MNPTVQEKKVKIREAENQNTTPPSKRTESALEFLPVAYTDAEILKMADSMARYEAESEQLQEQFEVIKLDFKHKQEALAQSIRTLSRNIRKRTHYENVNCKYILEEPTPAEKTLVRLDTGEIVRVLPMDSRDYQDPLPMVLKTPAADPIDRTDSFSLVPPSGKDAATGEKEIRPQ